MSKKLVEAMADLDEDLVLEEVKALVGQKVPAMDIIASLQEGMGIVGKRFEEKEYFLSELIMSAEIFNEASKLLGDGTGGAGNAGTSKYGTFVMGTIYDDIHDIGKNIVTTVMSSNGFNVVDLGVDVPTAKYVEAIKQYKPKVIGISCLLTTAFDNIKECIQTLEKEGLRKDIKILIGGGPVDEATCKYVGADHVCKNAQETVEYSKKYMGIN
ncbi:MAG: cobalamin-dependent protein [Clostridiales bacterium]|jgi:methylmalonyl-CoA mutase cobalamin-binding domain/chain|nr:cobalamin-dependent protein [Eubacteriales bacterium]MDH7565465.1 cobalamin-dependent protein [Clostridiales bacterium]